MINFYKRNYIFSIIFFYRSLAVNFKAVINISQLLSQKWMENKYSGVIVNVSSVASKISFKDHAVYGATKAALDSLTSIMALELGTSNIRINSVNPTVIMTERGRKGWTDPTKAGPLLARTPLGR